MLRFGEIIPYGVSFTSYKQCVSEILLVDISTDTLTFLVFLKTELYSVLTLPPLSSC